MMAITGGMLYLSILLGLLVHVSAIILQFPGTVSLFASQHVFLKTNVHVQIGQ